MNIVWPYRIASKARRSGMTLSHSMNFAPLTNSVIYRRVRGVGVVSWSIRKVVKIRIGVNIFVLLTNYD